MKISSIKFEKSVAQIHQLPTIQLPEIAFAGRSNVGKSTLINCLLNNKRIAKTSSRPGKTRLLNFFVINESFYMVDLPGYGFAKVPVAEKLKWQQLIASYFQVSKSLKGIVVITDIRHPLTNLDIEMIQWVEHLGIPLIVVGTKADKLSANKLAAQFSKNEKQLRDISPNAALITFSSLTRDGKNVLWNSIDSLIRK